MGEFKEIIDSISTLSTTGILVVVIFALVLAIKHIRKNGTTNGEKKSGQGQASNNGRCPGADLMTRGQTTEGNDILGTP